MKLKQNDTVKVITGKDKGKTGTVRNVLSDQGKVIVTGVNTRKKHQRSSKNKEAGEIIEQDAPIDASNVALIDPDSGVPTRVGYQIDAKGNKNRIARKSGKKV